MKVEVIKVEVIKDKISMGSWCTLCNTSIEDREIYYLLTIAERDKDIFIEPKYQVPHICQKCFKDGIKFIEQKKEKSNY